MSKLKMCLASATVAIGALAVAFSTASLDVYWPGI